MIIISFEWWEVTIKIEVKLNSLISNQIVDIGLDVCICLNNTCRPPSQTISSSLMSV